MNVHIRNSVINFFYDTLSPLVIPSMTLMFVVKSYFAPTAIDTTIYKPIVLEGSSGILSFMFFLRSSDICPITMSMYLIEPCCCLKLGKWYCCDYPIVHLLRIDRSY